jgi:serine kinase of HPr protein (carbohydrate metabolism regulator)
MKNSRINLHATGIVLGRQGFLIVGPSGSGKSRLAAALLADAARSGVFAALISDDQVWIEEKSGTIIAHRAETIKDLMEIRFSGIVHQASLRSAVIDAVLAPVCATDTLERLPPPHETMEILPQMFLPVLRLCVEFNPTMAMVERIMESRMGASCGRSRVS